ncbi:hypothetical protein PHYSODRAFT_332972 [Phytophthora sojae]|uniref:WRKY19-like zinc finger domain-containing protein n=1 Tax=Phytophthora sojae (strain P6497) TaxID=1094619 RepID=G4ZM87_PHYSP|nr:hypothetical protein PHYSODRAFT_332972 [Phytophthora sojae]EGZ14620.1 hypothetical protein PHYSODRAFT_332972 [Phytophthora sojae]|eukprot:XP_009528369.1 hypothetical protein PHYSODRAFT_332972 [Phytophthora sojae]
MEIEDAGVEMEMVRGIGDGGIIEKAEAVVIASSEHEWQDEDFEDGTCLLSDCTNTAQANGFCYAHGGYQVCYALGCNRRAAVRAFHRKRAVSSDTNDLHTAEYDGNGKSAKNQKVWVQLDYCDKHLDEEELDGDHAAEASSQAQPHETIRATDRRYRRHSVCKWLGCMKWVMRDGDPSEYCVLHRAQDGSSVISRGSSVASFTHSEDESSVEQVEATEFNGEKDVQRDYKSPVLCKEPGCSKQGSVYGDKRGYCF